MKKELWLPEIGGQYYFVNQHKMVVESEKWGNSGLDNERYGAKVVFEREEEANQYLDYLKMMVDFDKETENPEEWEWVIENYGWQMERDLEID